MPFRPSHYPDPTRPSRRVIVEKWEAKKAIEEQAKVQKDIYAKHFK